MATAALLSPDSAGSYPLEVSTDQVAHGIVSQALLNTARAIEKLQHVRDTRGDM